MSNELKTALVADGTGSPEAEPYEGMIRDRNDDAVILAHLAENWAFVGLRPVIKPLPGVKLYFTRPRPADAEAA